MLKGNNKYGGKNREGDRMYCEGAFLSGVIRKLDDF